MNRKRKLSGLRVTLIIIAVVSLLLASCASAETGTVTQATSSTTNSPSQEGAIETTAGSDVQPTSSTADSPSQNGAIKISFVGPLTGPDGVEGKACEQAARLAVDLANEAGGVCGRQIEFEAYDTKSDPKEGANIATLICNDSSSMGVVSDFNSSVSLAQAPIYNECKISQVNYWAAAPDIPKKGGSYTFRVYPPGQNMSIYIADWLFNRENARKFAVIYENSDYGIGLYDSFVAKVKELGGEIVAAEAVAISQTDLSAVVSKFKAAKPDAVVGMVSYQVGAYYSLQSKEMDFNLPLYGSDGLYFSEIVKMGGEAVEGLHTVAAYSIDSSDPVVSAFVTAYKEAYGDNPSNAGGYSYDAANAIIKALEETDCAGREAVQEWLATKLVDVKGVTGVITLEERERSYDPGMYTPMEIKDGKFVEVK